MDLMTVGQSVLQKLNEAGHEAYFVGGMVRDQLLKRPIYDVDITTSAHPEEVMRLFDKTIGTGLAHGTVTVMMNKVPIEVTTFRVETGYQDYRRPEEVSFTTSLEEDLKRRDFTINAIAQDKEGNLYDLMNGLDDLSEQRLRCVGEAVERFTEDPLRMLRGIRFVSKLGFELETQTFSGMKQVSSLISHVSKERVKKELEGMMNGTFKDVAMRRLYETDLLRHLSFMDELITYETYSFEKLSAAILLFALVGLRVENLESYLNEWPFSKDEKRKIIILTKQMKQPIPSRYFMYRYGEEMAKLSHELECFLQREETAFVSESLPIQNRKELAIDVARLLNIVNRPKGPWIQQLLEALEYQVVMGHVENQLQALTTWIKEDGISDKENH